MAALRRIGAILSTSRVWTAPRHDLFGPKAANIRYRRMRAAVGLGVVAAGGAAIYLCYRQTGAEHGALQSRVNSRALLPSLPAVAAKEKAEPLDLEDDGGVYMSSHEHRFRLFSSVEYGGQLYMTPQNFIESVTMSEPRHKKPWRSLTKQELEKILSDTPPVWKGTSKLFRNLRERGIIAYTEYLFLLCILTKPHAGFKIAFNMFDADGNQMVDKREFLVLQEIFRKKNEKRGRKGDTEKSAQLSMQLYGYQVAPVNSALKRESVETAAAERSYWDMLRRGASHALFSDLAERVDETMMIDTTLLVHFFGKKGKAELTFDDFYRFMDNLQTEVLEIEFLNYSRGMTTISEEDFARILLRYTDVEDIRSYLDNVRQTIPDEKGITFEEFRSFFQFLNNLEDFTIAMQMYNFASRSIGQDEFARAVYVATGLKLTRHLVNTIFKIFDVDHDDQLSYKEFIGIMKDRLHRGVRGYKTVERFTSYKSCLKKELAGSR
ncbi:calcium uptake protein 3, mitochondrial isoform X2 [Electrophorus electricus]|uniref:calcium uptake protein 3, mitochondrial isoform X2 n=1 Tax=Electrophorus electricus TaxID=8005 RepID=UPI0015D0B8D3|nr:calcium uptake protein 3, mitochondrial isoform X2 [Electrophorus electricus]